MFSITDVFKLIPDSLKQSAVDAVVQTITERGEGLISQSVLNKIKGLRSDAAFRQQFDAGLQRGLQRFVNEYQIQDEDLVAAVIQAPDLFATPDVQAALVAIVQQPGRYLVEEQAVLDQSFAVVLPERINRERVDQAVFYLLKCLARELWHLPELQPIYSLEFQRITAESAREQLTVQKAQLAALETLNAGVRDSLLQLTDALRTQKQLPAGPAGPATTAPRPAVYHNLPQPDYGEFVGRQKEIGQIFDLLRPYPQSRHHLIVIDGIGGIGKSALALEVAHRCLHASMEAARGQQTEQDHLTRLRQILLDRFSEEELQTLCFDLALDYDMLPGKSKGGKARELLAYLERRNRLSELIELIQRERPNIHDAELFAMLPSAIPQAEQFEAIIWTSAKRTALTSTGIITRHQNISTLYDIYRIVAVALERKDILRARTKEQSELIRQALTRQRILLVIDNFETIDDESLVNFLQELPAPTKAIVTTRHRLDVAYPIRLSEMSWEEAETLIERECDRKNVVLPANDAKKLYSRTGGVPLAIVWSIAQIAYGYNSTTVLSRLGQPNNDIIRFCFMSALNIIQNTAAHKVLISLSTLVSGAQREILGYVSELSEFDRDEALVLLETLSLINRQGGRFVMLPLTKQMAQVEASVNQDLLSQIKELSYDYYYDFLKTRRDLFPRFAEITPEYENILDLLDWCLEAEREENFAQLFDLFETYLWAKGLWGQVDKYLEDALLIAKAKDDTSLQGRFHYSLGAFAWYRKELHLAAHHFERAYLLREAAGEQLYSIGSLGDFAVVKAHLGEYEVAKAMLEQALITAKKANLDRAKARLERNYAVVEIKVGNYDHALELLHESKQFRESYNQITDGLGIAYRYLGEASLGMGNFQKAHEYYEQSLEIAKSLGIELDTAYAKLGLAYACKELNRLNEAYQLSSQALASFDNLRMPAEKQEAEDLLSSLPDDIADFAGTKEETQAEK